MSEQTHQERKKKTTNKCSLSRKLQKMILRELKILMPFLITRLQFEKVVQTWCHKKCLLLSSINLAVLWSVTSGLEGQDET